MKCFLYEKDESIVLEFIHGEQGVSQIRFMIAIEKNLNESSWNCVSSKEFGSLFEYGKLPLEFLKTLKRYKE